MTAFCYFFGVVLTCALLMAWVTLMTDWMYFFGMDTFQTRSMPSFNIYSCFITMASSMGTNWNAFKILEIKDFMVWLPTGIIYTTEL